MKKFLISAVAILHFSGSVFADALPINVVLQPAQPPRITKAPVKSPTISSIPVASRPVATNSVATNSVNTNSANTNSVNTQTTKTVAQSSQVSKPVQSAPKQASATTNASATKIAQNTASSSSSAISSQVASTVNKNIAQSSVQKTSISQCSETVSVNSEQLFYLTLTALNKMNYKIKEVQSKTGTVLFEVAQREFMVTIADLDSNKTFIKILPTNSDYGFSPALIQNVFYFVKANSSVTPTIL